MSEHILPKRMYITVWAVLMALMVLTAILSRVPMGRELNTIIALIIASIKASLVLLFFMHLKYEDYKLSGVVFIAGFFWLMIFFGLTLTDYLSRHLIGIPGH
jgi:cytochrome c oxidase subunit IV